jgi:hypothetical protein
MFLVGKFLAANEFEDITLSIQWVGYLQFFFLI